MSVLSQQVAVVTGAGRGIGRAIALKLAAARGGHRLRVPHRGEFRQGCGRGPRPGRQAWPLAVDVSDAAAVTAAAEQIPTRQRAVDILVNNAGVTRDGLLMRMSEADWDAVLNTNLRGAFVPTKAFARTFLKSGGASSMSPAWSA